MKKLAKKMRMRKEALESRAEELRANKGNKGKKGFTLIELIVVMAIIGILVLLAAPQFLGYTKDASASAVTQDTKVLSDAAFQYNIENEAWPTGTAYTATIGGVASDAVLLDDTLKTDGYVKNISNEFGDYVLITSGDREGEVVSIEGTPNKDGDQVHGAGIVDTAAGTDDVAVAATVVIP